MALIVHGDFTDPLSWIASRRVDALQATGTEVEWHAVRSHPSTTVTTAPVDAAGEKGFAEAAAWLHETALPGEPLLESSPRTSPSSAPAVSAFAEAVVAGIPDHVRQRLFEHFWVEHQDIGNPDVLRRLLTLAFLHARSPSDVVSEYGYAVAISGGPITSDAWLLLEEWRAEYEAHGRPVLPLLTHGATTVTGYAALSRLGALVTEAGGGFSGHQLTPLPAMPVSARRLSIERPGRRPLWRDG